ncbi:MAG TPA: hypothetical protein VKY66_00465 [Protaetiibacter sp.]|nr:hypothetical protein [Protaetiibacter sp.]
MRALNYAGSELVTSDAVADALIDYVVTLPTNHPPEPVTIPALQDGREVTARFLVTAQTPLLVTSSDEPETPLRGAEHAVDVLRHRARRLDSIGYELRG